MYIQRCEVTDISILEKEKTNTNKDKLILMLHDLFVNVLKINVPKNLIVDNVNRFNCHINLILREIISNYSSP